MKTCRIATDLRIAPFDDPVGETFVLQRTLADWQREAVAGCAREGLSSTHEDVRPGDAIDGPALVYRDDTFFTAPLLSAFLAAAGPATGRLAARACLFLDKNAALQDLDVVELEGERHYLFPVVRVAAGERWTVGADDELAPIPVALDEKRIEVPVPRQYFGSGTYEHAVTGRAIFCVRHWVHVLRVNQAAAGAAVEVVPLWKRVLVLLWAILRAFSLNKWRVLAKLGERGKGCDVHPTAVVEGSTLGKGCVIGPGARVRFSHLGDGVMVLGGAQVEFSTVGAGAMISQNSAVNFCVLYPEAVASQDLMQLCVLGRGATTTPGSFCLDMHFEKEIRVEHDGRLQSCGERFLGSCLGHGARLGTGFWLRYGRAIPNGYQVVRAPESVLSTIPPDLPPGVPLFVREGTLVTARPAAPESAPEGDR